MRLGLLACALLAGGLTGCGSPSASQPALAAAPAVASAPAAAASVAGVVAAPAASASAGEAPNPASAPAGPLRLRLMAFNDFHGQLESARLALTLPDPADPQRSVGIAAGGAPALAGLVQALRQGSEHSVLISSGDMVGAAPPLSTLLRHEPTIDVMNRIGVDVATLGNHEFDAGLPELQRLLGGGCASEHPVLSSCVLGRHGGARFAVTAANVRRSADGSAVFAPAVVRSFEGVKVGFIGAVTRETPSIVTPSGVAGLRFEDEARAINQTAQALLAQGVQTLVAVVHEGGEIGAATPGALPDWNDPTCPGARGDLFGLQRKLLPQVAVVFSAHTHQGYRCQMDGRWVMQAYSYGRGVSVVDLVIDRHSGQVDRPASTSRNLPVLNERSHLPTRDALVAATPLPWRQALRDAKPDAAIAQRVAAYAEGVAPRIQRPVGQIRQSFARTPGPGGADSPAARLVADAQLAATRALDQGGAQVALMNPGGVRTDLPCPVSPEPCAVSYGQAFAMQPFGNSLVVMTLSGRELKALLESQRRGTHPPLLLAPSHGLSYRWLSKARPGQQVADLMLEGRPVREEQSIRVTVNSFLAEGGDGFAVLRAGRNRLGGPQDVDALAAYLARSPHVSAESRIKVEE